MQKFISTIVILYAIMLILSPQKANFMLALLLILAIPALILRHIFMDKLYKYSINMVSKQFIIGNNALSNEHCTVKYTPDEKIVVVDNFVTKNHGKRMFTLKKGSVNINKAWNRLCRVYDSFISLDSLAAFFSYDTKVDIITLENKLKEEKKSKEISIDATNQGPKFVELAGIQPDPYVNGTNVPNAAGASFVNIDKLQEQKPYVKPEEKAPEFSELGDILSTSSNKIDVNFATPSEIAILPGINIVKAKKIVEFRDKNGLFKDVNDFLKVAEIKEHFVDKIKPMIVAGKPAEPNDNSDTDYGRIVDF